MDLPHQDAEALRKDLEHLAGLNRTFGARRAVAALNHHLAANLIARARSRRQEVAVIAMDCQLKTLQIARRATPSDHKMLFVQADARQLPLRTREADVVFCSLALHHFSDSDALTVLREMRRVGRIGSACIDLVRSRLASFGIWLLTTFIVQDPMVRHDARLSIRRAFTAEEMKAMADRAGWPSPEQIKFLWFQQAVLARVPVSD
jgi:ubiquinone/menaquinone biosynthesis C-methylase UbiE